MEHIIQQLALDLGKKILKKAIEGDHDLDILCKEVLEDCKNTASRMVESILTSWNEDIREDKAGRKSAGLVMQQRDRKRAQITALGLLQWQRDCYYDKANDEYVYLLDEVTGVRKYERITGNVSAELINQAAFTSYKRSADIVTGGAVSKQSVRNRLLKLEVPEAEKPEEKKTVKELHVYADEDHVHLQREHKEKGKRGQMIPMVTVTEGTRAAGSRRNETINPVRFVDEGFSSKNLWKAVEGYVGTAFDTEMIEKIWIHGDGGQWIKNGLENFAQTVHVMDGYHFFKRLRGLSLLYPQRNVRIVIINSLKEDDRGKADTMLQDLMRNSGNAGDAEQTRKFGTYLFGHWDEIRRLITEDIPGSCTEGQVSHVLSERFSRDPLGWSKAALGKLAGARVSIMNGRPIKREDFSGKSERTKYAEYADMIIKEQCEGNLDWSIFEREPDIVDIGSNTQYLIRSMGEARSLLN